MSSDNDVERHRRELERQVYGRPEVGHTPAQDAAAQAELAGLLRLEHPAQPEREQPPVLRGEEMADSLPSATAVRGVRRGTWVAASSAIMAVVVYLVSIPTPSLAVFDQAAAAADQVPWPPFSPQEPPNARWIGEVGDLQIYAIRADERVCLWLHDHVNRSISTTCTRLDDFAVVGLSATAAARLNDSKRNSLVEVQWGPVGPPRVSEVGSDSSPS